MALALPVLDGVDLTAMSDDDLEVGICGFAARLAAATCVWLLAIGEYDRRRAWADWGCKSMAHWLTWKCALGPVAAREHVRVAAALAGLPQVTAAFRDGRLSYSQVRAVSRVATGDTEGDFVELARSSTASQLESVVRGYRSVRAQAEDRERSPRAHRSLDWHIDDDGSLVGSFRLPAEVGAVVRLAVETAIGSLRRDGAEASDTPDDPVADPWRATAADALALVADGYLTAVRPGDGGASDGGDDRYLVTIVAEQRVLEAPADQPVDGVCHVEDGGPLAATAVRRLACDQPTIMITEDQHGRVLDVGRRTRRPNRALRRALQRRDGHCQFPGCTTRRTEAHHVDHWLDGGATRLDNLISLCSHHHHRHHDGLYVISVQAGGSFAFVRSDGRAIPPVVTAVDRIESADPGVDPAVPTCTPEWDGTGLQDLSWIVGTMLRNHGLVDDSLPADHRPLPDVIPDTGGEDDDHLVHYPWRPPPDPPAGTDPFDTAAWG